MEMPTIATREIHGARFGIIAGFEVDSRRFAECQKLSSQSARVDWFEPGDRDPTRVPTVIADFRTAEGFLTQKMLFVSRDHARTLLPSRGLLRVPIDVDVVFASHPKAEVSLRFQALFSYFRRPAGAAQPNVLTVLLFSELPPISVDRLIFLKQAKWYPVTREGGWRLILKNANAVGRDVSQLLTSALKLGALDASRVQDNKQPPIFDLTELRSIGPARAVTGSDVTQGKGDTAPGDPSESVFPGPFGSLTSMERLSAEEHWGLLTGDEGYRLIDATRESGAASILYDPKMQFKSRQYFFYHFSTTSCLAFYTPTVDQTKANWADWYTRNVGDIAMLDAYVRLDSPVPCLGDGMPLLVEACLARYIELRRLAEDLDMLVERGFVKAVLDRFRGATNLEKALHRLEQLDLYNDGNILWIIGGTYTDELFKYSAIRARIDRTLKNVQAVEAERVRLLIQLSVVALTIMVSIAIKVFAGKS